MPTAVLITPDLTAQRIDLPADPSEQRSTLRRLLGVEDGGVAEPAYYHPNTVFHLGGNSMSAEPDNYAAWALACTWRGLHIPYPLCGPVVVTGPMEEDSAAYADLDADHADQAQHVTDTARTVLTQNPDGVPATQLLEAVKLP